MAKTLQKLDMGKATVEGNGLDMHAFKGFTSLTSVIIPDSTVYIDYETYNDCKGLTLIAIPDSVKVIAGIG